MPGQNVNGRPNLFDRVARFFLSTAGNAANSRLLTLRKLLEAGEGRERLVFPQGQRSSRRELRHRKIASPGTAPTRLLCHCRPEKSDVSTVKSIEAELSSAADGQRVKRDLFCQIVRINGNENSGRTGRYVTRQNRSARTKHPRLGGLFQLHQPNRRPLFKGSLLVPGK